MKTVNRAEMKRLFTTAVVIGIAAVATACGTQGAASAPRSSGPEATAVAVEAAQAKEQRIALAEEVVRNGKYELPGIGSFQLKDGNYQERYGDGATQVKRVGVVAVAFGDLDGDKIEDAAVVLWANTGGTGTFIYLAPVLNRGGKGEQAGAELLGDRVEIKSLAVSSGRIRLELLAQGAADPMVSPSLQAAREYALRDGKLVGVTAPDTTAQPAATPAPRPTPPPASQPAQSSSGLNGAIWIWQRFVGSGDRDSFAVPYPAAYRLELLADGKYSTQADCNRGAGSYALEGSRLTLNPGPLTLAECQRGSKSSQFVQLLPQVATYALDGETLTLKTDVGAMLFTRLAAVTGRITGPAGVTVPAGSTAEVMLSSASGAQIGGVIVKAELPMEFEVPFKPASIDPSAAYSLEVTFKDAQKGVIFKSTRAYSVLTLGNPTYHLEVVVDRVGAPTTGAGIDPARVTLDTRGLPFPSYRVDRVAARPYDASTPPGPKGMPEHLEINFGLIDQPGPRAFHPVVYIIPAEDYAQLWQQSGNGAVATAMGKIRDLGRQIPSPAPVRGLPILPYELSGGVNDLAVQVKSVVAGDGSSLGAGFRYVGRFAQDANPVTNNGRLRYIYQGFTRDGKWLVSFSCEVYTTALPDFGKVPADVQTRFASDYQGYMHETAVMLNALPSSAWELNLERLDALMGSIRFPA